MKTEEKTSVNRAAQVVFRPSVERRGHYLCHFGHLAPDGTFAEESELSFWDFLKTLEVPDSVVSVFLADFDVTEKVISRFGYLSQDCFDEFMRRFAEFYKMVQLYPGMLVLTFKEKME